MSYGGLAEFSSELDKLSERFPGLCLTGDRVGSILTSLSAAARSASPGHDRSYDALRATLALLGTGPLFTPLIQQGSQNDHGADHKLLP
jgi:hypothetical protein